MRCCCADRHHRPAAPLGQIDVLPLQTWVHGSKIKVGTALPRSASHPTRGHVGTCRTHREGPCASSTKGLHHRLHMEAHEFREMYESSSVAAPTSSACRATTWTRTAASPTDGAAVHLLSDATTGREMYGAWSALGRPTGSRTDHQQGSCDGLLSQMQPRKPRRRRCGRWRRSWQRGR